MTHNLLSLAVGFRANWVKTDEQEGNVLFWLGLVFVIMGTIFAIRRFIRYRQKREARMKPIRLFFGFGSELGLNIYQCQQLLKIATRLKLHSPFSLLMSPGTLNYYTAMYMAEVKGKHTQHIENDIKRIHEHLFND